MTEDRRAETSRRAFLRRTAALVATPTLAGWTSPVVAPIPVAAKRPPLRADEPVRIGVIGTGGMGTEHAVAFARLASEGANVQVAALCDICSPRLENAWRRLATNHPDEVALHFDYARLLADPRIHGVIIASPEHWHARMAEDAIAAGKDVYIEKPLTLRLNETLRLRAIARANPSVIVEVGTQYVTIPSYIEARRLIADDAIGKPVFSQTSYCRNSKDGEWLYYEIDPDWTPGVNLDWRAWCGPLGERPWDAEVFARWRRYRDYSTGIIGDLLVHRITPLMMAIDPGWPTRVVASGGHYVDLAMENHDQVNMNIEFEAGHTMIVAGSTCNEVGLETMIRGHRANLYVGGRNTVLRPERIYAEEIEEQTIEGEDIGNPQDRLRLDWLECIRSRRSPASDIELATKVMVVVELATRSLWEGRAFGWDSAGERVTVL